jgi:hypothetical protein
MLWHADDLVLLLFRARRVPAAIGPSAFVLHHLQQLCMEKATEMEIAEGETMVYSRTCPVTGWW